MLTLTGNCRLTRDVELRATRNGQNVATVSVASDRRDREADPVYVDLVIWEGQAEAAADHLVKGQAVAFTSRFKPRPYQTSSGEQRVAIEVHNVDLDTAPSRAPPSTRRPTRRTWRSDGPGGRPPAGGPGTPEDA